MLSIGHEALDHLSVQKPQNYAEVPSRVEAVAQELSSLETKEHNVAKEIDLSTQTLASTIEEIEKATLDDCEGISHFG